MAAQLIATEPAVAPRAEPVKRARDQLLAGAALAFDEHGKGRGGCTGDGLAQRFDGRAGADDVRRERVAGMPHGQRVEPSAKRGSADGREGRRGGSQDVRRVAAAFHDREPDGRAAVPHRLDGDRHRALGDQRAAPGRQSAAQVVCQICPGQPIDGHERRAVCRDEPACRMHVRANPSAGPFQRHGFVVRFVYHAQQRRHAVHPLHGCPPLGLRHVSLCLPPPDLSMTARRSRPCRHRQPKIVDVARAQSLRHVQHRDEGSGPVQVAPAGQAGASPHEGSLVGVHRCARCAGGAGPRIGDEMAPGADGAQPAQPCAPAAHVIRVDGICERNREMPMAQPRPRSIGQSPAHDDENVPFAAQWSRGAQPDLASGPRVEPRQPEVPHPHAVLDADGVEQEADTRVVHVSGVWRGVRPAGAPGREVERWKPIGRERQVHGAAISARTLPRRTAGLRPRGAPGRCRNFDRMARECCGFSQPASRTGRRSS